MSDVTFIFLLLWSLSGVFCDNESVSVMDGDSVTLSVNLTESQREEGISWKFGRTGVLIAGIMREDNNVRLFDDKPDGRFKNRLKLNNHTGSLTITNTNITHTGLYQLINTKTNIKLKSFNINVYARLPAPVISKDSSQSSSSRKNHCVLLCSVLKVKDVRDVSLSWYKGNSSLSIISVSDLNIRLSLPLEVDYQDNNTYSCVLNNTIRNQTQHLNINEVCQSCSDFCCCGFTEAVIRLVVSALVGVATIAVLVYDIRTE
nr:SLAM family member 6-like isoform X2 [Misgurnus anguillicaudatus]